MPEKLNLLIRLAVALESSAHIRLFVRHCGHTLIFNSILKFFRTTQTRMNLKMKKTVGRDLDQAQPRPLLGFEPMPAAPYASINQAFRWLTLVDQITDALNHRVAY